MTSVINFLLKRMLEKEEILSSKVKTSEAGNPICHNDLLCTHDKCQKAYTCSGFEGAHKFLRAGFQRCLSEQLVYLNNR